VILGPELNAKRTQLLLDAVPTVRRIAVLATDPALDAVQVAAIRKVVADAGLEFLAFYAAPPDYRAAFAAMSAARADALVVTSAPEYLRDWAAALHSFALAAGLPTACQWREMAEQGCLLGYGPSYAEIYRRTADLVARVFRGARPAELPIEGPTHFEFMINLRTANALGITIPPNLLARADEVIE
jgi:putative ABC transport system substrate-binding protein